MVIDFHTHIFPDALAPRAYASLTANAKGLYTPSHDLTRDGLLAFMEKSGVDKSVVLPVLTKREQVFKTNEWARSLESDKIIPFGGVYPSEHYKEDIDFVCSLGFKGIKLHAEYQHFVCDSDDMLRFYDYAFSKGLIIIQHAGYDPISVGELNTSPKRFAHVAEELRGGVMVCAHFGGQSQWDDVEKYLAGSNVYLDTSMGTEYYGEEKFKSIVEKHGADKILFGSDSPWSDAGKEIANLKSMLSANNQEKIFHENAERILGL